jgi:ATPase subunit of ABC transporter with duplicated ATPase domains
MIFLQNLTYIHPNKDLLFDNINLAINKHSKIALIGNNGSGKSTLLKIMAGLLQASEGLVKTVSAPYYVPQVFGQYNELTIAQALRVEDKLNALKEILDGKVTETNLTVLGEDWTIEERCREALSYWKIDYDNMGLKMEALSGGQKTKVFLAGVLIHRPEIILLDEPSNHLDIYGRKVLYDFINSSTSTILAVSHDRKLLNLLSTVCELSRGEITVYGGNYEFYREQKLIEDQALANDLKSKEKALRKAKEAERETIERQQKLDARGKKKQEKAGLPKIMLNTLKNKAENSTSRLKGVHAEKVGAISKELSDLRREIPETDKIKLSFEGSALHTGKVLITANNLNFRYDHWLWKEALNFRITSGERIALKGSNGSGKTSLIHIILGKLEPQAGAIYRAANRAIYMDQDYSLLDNTLGVYEQAQKYNFSGLQEHEVKIRLNRFLFPKEEWDKPCIALSGGEKMRLILCCMILSNVAPDIIVLDEPTNNLDIQNIEILIGAVREYQGTLIVVSHDDHFLEQVDIDRVIDLDQLSLVNSDL